MGGNMFGSEEETFGTSGEDAEERVLGKEGVV